MVDEFMGSERKIGFLFPGQGAQFVGMGKDLCEAFPEALAVYELAESILRLPIRKISFEGPEDDLTRTLYAQPSIMVASLAAWAVLKAKFPELRPSFSAGLSLGEFPAVIAAGGMTMEDGLRLIRVRAEAMEAASERKPGTMASIMGLSAGDCRSVAAEAGCEVANLNTPEQTVLSGTVETIEKACRLAEGRGAKRAIVLKVGGAFHSSLMQYAEDSLKLALSQVEIRMPECVFVPNSKGLPVSDPSEIRELLARQLTSSEKWVDTMQQAQASGTVTFLEIGPGRVLKGLARKCQPGLEVHPAGTAADIGKLETVLGPLLAS